MIIIYKGLTRLARWFEYFGSLVLSAFFQLKLETWIWNISEYWKLKNGQPRQICKISEYRKASKNYATWPDMFLELRKISEEYRKLTWPDMPVKYWRQPSGAADGLWIQLIWWQSKKKGFSAEFILRYEQIIYFSWKRFLIGNGKGIINLLTIKMRMAIDMRQPPVLIWLLRIIRINMTVLNLETSSICIEWSLSSTLLEFLKPGDNIITFFFTATKHFNLQIHIQN